MAIRASISVAVVNTSASRDHRLTVELALFLLQENFQEAGSVGFLSLLDEAFPRRNHRCSPVRYLLLLLLRKPFQLSQSGHDQGS